MAKHSQIIFGVTMAKCVSAICWRRENKTQKSESLWYLLTVSVFLLVPSHLKFSSEQDLIYGKTLSDQLWCDHGQVRLGNLMEKGEQNTKTQKSKSLW